jgi:hypothetical protein
MKIELTRDELDFLISCVNSDRESGVNYVMHFDTTEHDEMLHKLYMAEDN